MTNAKLVVTLLIAPGALAACASNRESTGSQTAASERTAATEPPEEQAPMAASQVAVAIENLPQPDRDFVKQAASVNLAAIRFGELAANNGASVETRSLGREMVDTHTSMSDQLRASAAVEGITLPMARLTQRQQQMYDALSKLSGQQFDRQFERDVVKLQQETIDSFQNEAVHGKLSELAMLANQSLPVLNQRVRTVRNQMHRM